MANSSSCLESWNHDVFLSFRGEDTRDTFVYHLYEALVAREINTFKDDKSLQRGESIGPSLLKAIKRSQIAIIVFSENYACSPWCLDELTYIMKCKKKRAQIVLPVFYNVRPSEVRGQKGKFGKEFSKHELENNNKVESWRKALTDTSNIAGWKPKYDVPSHELECIKDIVDTVSHRVLSTNSSANENLIGVETRVQDLKSKLQFESGGKLMIGIWGVGGGGKTTLASCVYNEISRKFDCCCFLENIREESSKYGLKKLQEKLLSSVLRQKQVEIETIEKGKHLIKSVLCRKKVLIVLDDVDHVDQLEALAGSHDWFGEGSRIIITTRDNHLLNANKVNVIHNISLLNDDEGIKLFRKHAFPDYQMMEDYEMLSKDVVSYANGLPLALKVLGSFLCDKNMNEWMSALDRLRKIPDNNILEKLKVSYDGLENVEKELFLDVVCFFRGKRKGKAIEILDACDFHPVIGLKVLVQKALITISDGKLDMHDLVQEMGHYIVRGEYPNNPEKHSRVWKVEDVTNICSMDPTTELDKIKTIRIISHMDDPLPRDNHHVVANMKKLRWIDWKGHRASSLPTNFPQRELCCLILSAGQQTRLWNGYKSLPNLKMIKLDGLKNLIMTPNFDGLPNLERFILNGSPYLEEIHPSIENLKRLVFLHITSCANLKMFPSITGITKLETLSLSKCNKLSKSGKEFASYNQYQTKFFVARLRSFFVHKSLNRLGLQVISRDLRKLNLSNCHLGDEDVDFDVWDLPNLQELDLSYNIFSRLNFSILQLSRLKWLDVSFCKSLVELSEVPSSISVLRADYCGSLASVGNISKCKWLWKISLMGKNKFNPDDEKKLLDFMSQGNAIEHHFMSLALEHRVLKYTNRQAQESSSSIFQPPHKWYDDFCGFLIHGIIEYQEPFVTIIIKEEHLGKVECNYQNKLISPLDPPSYIGYVSFSSLRKNTWLNPSYNLISFYTRGMFEVELVPRKSSETRNGAQDFSGFWDEECEDRKTFTIRQDSKSSINILWRPC